MQKRSRYLSLALVAVLAACGKTDSSNDAADSVLAATPPVPQNPHVVAFDIGRQLDEGGRVVGGSTDKFSANDTISVSVRAQYTKEGDEVSGLLRKGAQTIDSISAKLAAPDSSGFVTVPLRFGSAKAWAKGVYQVETFLGTVSQGIKEITVQ